MREDWKSITLNEICIKITSGGTPLRKKIEYYGGNIPWVKTKQVNYNRIYDSEEYLSDIGLKNSSAKLIPANSVIVAMYGDGNTAGRCAINKVPVTTNQACCNLIIDKNKADYNFIFYYISTQYNKLVSLKSGAGQQNLNAQTFKEFIISLPPLETQRKIASILSGYDDLIENNLKRIKILEEMAQQTYEEWFVRMRFPGYETTVMNEESGLPEGWEKVKLNEIADFQNGYAFYTKGYSENGYAIIDLGNISEYGDLNISGTEKLISNELYNSLPKFHLKKYDIVIAMTDITSALRILAKSAIIDKDDTYALNQRVGMLRPNTELFNFAFLYALLSDYRFIERMKAMSKGAVQFYFNTKDIINYETFLPPKEIIDDFVSIYEPYLKTRMLLKDQNQRLRESRDILLPRLMMGMIEV